MSEAPAREVNSLLLPLIFSGAFATASVAYAFLAHRGLSMHLRTSLKNGNLFNEIRIDFLMRLTLFSSSASAKRANQALIQRVEAEIRSSEELKRKGENLV